GCNINRYSRFLTDANSPPPPVLRKPGSYPLPCHFRRIDGHLSSLTRSLPVDIRTSLHRSALPNAPVRRYTQYPEDSSRCRGRCGPPRYPVLRPAYSDKCYVPQPHWFLIRPDGRRRLICQSEHVWPR